MLSKILQLAKPLLLRFAADRMDVLGAGLKDTPGFDPRANYDKYEQLYYTNPDVASAVDLISAFAIGPGFEFKSENENAAMGCEQWAQQAGLKNTLMNCVKTHLVFGDAYSLIVQDAPLDLQVLHPRKIKVQTDNYGVVQRYVYDKDEMFTNDGNFMPTPDNSEERKLDATAVIDPENILHFRFNQIANNVYGLSMLHPAYNVMELKKRIELTTAFLAHRDAHRLLHAKVTIDPVKENARNPNTGKTYGQDKIDAVNSLLKDRVQEKTDGTWEVSNNIVTDQDVELLDLAASSNFEGINGVIGHLQQQSNKALKVPEVFLGIPEGSNRAVSYNQLKAFSLFVQSIQAVFAEEIQRKLIPQISPSTDVKIVFNEIIKEDEQTWAEVASKLYQFGIADLDEARQLVGLPVRGPDHPEQEE